MGRHRLLLNLAMAFGLYVKRGLPWRVPVGLGSAALLLLAARVPLSGFAAAHNKDDKEHPIGLAIGLGYGPTLVVEHDVWGDSVNTASKLGEDVGEAGEILVTQDFLAQLDKDQSARCKSVDTFKARGSKYPFYSCR